MTQIILSTYNKGGVGKTTLAVHITGAIKQEQLGRVLLVDCDPRPDSWSFYKKRRPQGEERIASVDKWLDILWNPPQPHPPRFRPIKKGTLQAYDYIIIDTDSPPEDTVAMISNNFPNLILIPINKSQKRSLNDLPSFLDVAASLEIRANREPNISYNPKFVIVPLGIDETDAVSKLKQAPEKPRNCQVASAMENFQDEINDALEHNQYIWDYPGCEGLYQYFIDLLEL